MRKFLFILLVIIAIGMFLPDHHATETDTTTWKTISGGTCSMTSDKDRLMDTVIVCKYPDGTVTTATDAP